MFAEQIMRLSWYWFLKRWKHILAVNIYIYIYICVCVCICGWVGGSVWIYGWFWLKKSPRSFFRWFWDFLKEKNFLFQFFLPKSFILNFFSNCNHYFQSVLVSGVLIAENNTKLSHTQQWFYWNSTFQSWILLKLHCLHN